nr:uncharacterized protein LOC113724214 [Coffea arabica]
MAQMMAKLNDKGKDMKGSSLELESRPKEDELYFRDKADIWFHGVFSGREAIPWGELSNALCERFGDGSPEEAIEEFNKLMQSGSVADYLDKFEMLKSLVMSSLPHLQDSYYKACFLSGLKEEIVTMVKMAKPKTLADAIDAAKLQERNLRALQKIHKPPSHGPNFQKPLPKTQNYPKWNSPNPKFPDNQTTKTHNNYTNNQDQFKKITRVELNHRREKGLCFKCVEPYTLGHICRQSHVNLLLMGDAEGIAIKGKEEKGDETDVFCDCIGGELGDELMEVSVHALERGSVHKTIRIKGIIKGRVVIVLVDSGSTHCFMDEQVARNSKLETNGQALAVRVANGEKLQSRSITKPITWKMQGYEFQHQFNTLKLGGCDMILGVNTVEDREQEQDRPALEIEGVLVKFDDVFLEPQGLPLERSQDHCITLKEGAKPFQIRPYRCPYIQKSEIEKQLNELIVKNKFPMPLIDELLDELHGSQYFTKIDLIAGYFQIRVRKEDIPKIAFRTHQGLYEFKIMPFGLTNTLATFQSLMNHVFQNQLRKHVLVFFDDILVYSPTLEEHLNHVTEVLDILRQHQLYAKRSKCSFAQKQVEYLGHITTAEGVRADPKKIDSMIQWPKPENTRQLKGFLGLTGYYRKFVKGYGAIAKPLTTFLKKDGFNWGGEAEEAFQKLKLAMCSTPVLAFPDFSQPFVIETDVCYGGIGVVLMQNRRPLAFLSQSLGQKNLGLSIYEKKLLALVTAVTKWRHYLEGHHFIINTDHQSLKYLLE